MPRRSGKAGKPPDLVRGVLSLHPRGFGFVTVDDGPDVFVTSEDRGAALHRDLVEVRVRAHPKGPTGKVVQVLERGLVSIAGSLRRRGKTISLQPGDPRLPATLPILGKLPSGVGDQHAVIAELVETPGKKTKTPSVRILSKLGHNGSAEVEVEKMLLREGLHQAFPDSMYSEIRRLPGRVGPAELSGREDLRRLSLVTIDPPDARDHDDAVWATRRKDGSFRVVIAIADVSHYVPEGSAMDTEAAARGCTHYLPDRVIPMLPLEISAKLASLVPDEDRLAMVLDVEVGPRGAIKSSRFSEAVIRSRARLSYAAAAGALGLIEQTRKERDREAERRRPLLKTLLKLSRVLRARRIRSGALFLESPASQVILDKKGEPTDVVRTTPEPGMRETYGMVEEVMLLANEITATELDRRGFATLYRVHEPPLAERLAPLAKIAEARGVPLPKAVRPGPLADWLRRVEQKGLAPLLHHRLLRAMRPATYDVDNLGHFALSKEHYLHFTSPIRRYPDLVVHRLVRRLVRGEPPQAEHQQHLEKVALQSRRRERAATLLSREAHALYGALLCGTRQGETFDATVTLVHGGGLGLILDQPAVEVRCPFEGLPGPRDSFEPDELELSLVGKKTGRKYSVGDRARARVVEVSIPRREVTVALE